MRNAAEKQIESQRDTLRTYAEQSLASEGITLTRTQFNRAWREVKSRKLDSARKRFGFTPDELAEFVDELHETVWWTAL